MLLYKMLSGRLSEVGMIPLMSKRWYERANEIRKEKKISLMDIATALNVSEGAVSHWLLGRRDVRFETIKRIAAVLNIPVSNLIEEDPDFAKNDLERQFLAALREIPQDKQGDILRMLKAFKAPSPDT